MKILKDQREYKKTLSALFCVYNEEQFIKGSLELILPFVDEVIVVDNGSIDNTLEIIQGMNSPKIKIFDYPKQPVVDMGAVRTFSLEQCTSDWFIAVDADEFYPSEAMSAIRTAIENATKAISFRVRYHNMTWRKGYIEDAFPHYPDRIYRTDVVEKYAGVLPVDMTFVKEKHLLAPKKQKGTVGILEYDNEEDKSFIHPKQPLIDVNFYHLARTRGYSFEYKKWHQYHTNLSQEKTPKQIDDATRANGWVNGKIEKKKFNIPEYIPTNNVVKPKLSVIITNYNYEKYVGEAIYSVFNQTVQPFEVIVVDDCSTDGSLEILSSLPVKLLKTPTNLGVVKARNRAIAESTGDYYLLLDADDRLKPDYIEKVLPLMEHSDIAYSDMEIFGETSAIHKYPSHSKQGMLEWQQIPSVCAIVDRHVWEAVEGFKDLIYEDWGFWLACTQKDFIFNKVDKPLFDYRTHPDGACKKNDLHQVTGFNELRKLYGITRQPDRGKENNI